MSTVALYVGWVVIGVAAFAAVTELWWHAGDFVYKHVLPLRWRKAQFTPVPGAHPLVSRRGLAAMYLLGGPRSWLSDPRRVFNAQRVKRGRLFSSSDQPKGEGQ